ncbi:MAG: hypothetical protein MJ192_04240 [Clostridia bacterium]|nr:hypothetical protein [Clostridia bacterium]
MDRNFYDELTYDSLKDLLHEPKNKYRIYPIEHNLCDPGANQETHVAHIREGGAGGFVSNVTWEDPRWMKNPDNLARLRHAADLAEKNGMQIWMYDDYYYPSGMANGYAVKDHPEYMAHFLDFYAAPVKAGETVSLPADNDGYLSAGLYDPDDYSLLCPLTVTDGTVTAPADGLLTAFFHNHEYAEAKQEPGKAKGHTDHVSREAVGAFIREGLQPVADAVGMSRFSALFTDEPTLSRVYMAWDRGRCETSCLPAPYSDELSDTYRDMWHEDLVDKLMMLFTGDSVEARRTRVRYYKTLSVLARRNFTDQVREWCHANGTLSSGHFLLEEGLKFHVCYYADFMRVVGGQDIPGCDVLCADASLYWKRGYGFSTGCSFAPKYPSSLARLEGGNVTMLEICPVMYEEKVRKDPFKEFMGLSTYMIFGGITHYNAYGYYYIRDEEQHRTLNRYVGRLLTLLRNAQPDTNVAVYYPIAQMQSLFALRTLTHSPDPAKAVDLLPGTDELESDMEILSETLYRAGFDYHVIDEDHLLKADIGNGLSCGFVRADTLIVPFSEFLTLPVLRQLKTFVEAGGKLIFLKTLPLYDEAGHDEEAAALLRTIPYTFIPDLTRLPAEIDYPSGIRLKAQEMLLSPYRLDGRRFWYVVNTSEADITVEAEGRGTVYDPEHDVWSELTETFVLPAERGFIVFEEA